MVIFISLSNTGQTPNDKFVFANFLAHESFYLNITSVGTKLVQHSSECAFKCLQKDPCLSFNLADSNDNMDKMLCELLPSDHYTHSEKFIANHLWYHYSIVVKLFFFFCFILSSRFLLSLLHPNNNLTRLKSFEQILFSCSTLIYLSMALSLFFYSSQVISKSFYRYVIEVCLTGFYQGSKKYIFSVLVSLFEVALSKQWNLCTSAPDK